MKARTIKDACSQMSLLKTSKAKVAVLQLGNARRSREITFGLDYVLSELDCNVSCVAPGTVDDADIVLFSMTSPLDVVRLVSAFKSKPTPEIVIGGQGAYPIYSYRHLTDKIMLGRAEGICNDVVMGSGDSDYLYKYADDKDVAREYAIRQAVRLLPGETTIGCRGKCKFCQYSVTRSLVGADYDPGSLGSSVTEDRWADVTAKTGNQTTALDGWSSETRRKVGKPISDKLIISKLQHIIDTIDGIMRLKVFQIVGYPWETEASLRDDILHFRGLLSQLNPGRGRIMMMVLNTPFSPEPFTAMEREPANLETRWRDILLGDDLRCIYDSKHINAFSLPQIVGPLTLLKRVAVNRGMDAGILRRLDRAVKIDDVEDLCYIAERGSGKYISRSVKPTSYDPHMTLI